MFRGSWGCFPADPEAARWFRADPLDEDLVQRPRAGQPRHRGQIELEAQEAAPRPDRAAVAETAVPVIGAQGTLDEREQLAQHAVFVETWGWWRQPASCGC